MTQYFAIKSSALFNTRDLTVRRTFETESEAARQLQEWRTEFENRGWHFDRCRSGKDYLVKTYPSGARIVTKLYIEKKA